MRSATSYFNGPLYRKTMARFWPLWAGYGVIWLFFIPLNMLNTYFSRYMSNAPQRRLLISAMNLPEMATFGLYLAAFFAILCAMAWFGLASYNSRSSCWFHALPTRREALFTTQYLAGLSFLLLPQLAPYVDCFMGTRGAIRTCVAPETAKSIALRVTSGSSMLQEDLSHEVVAVNIEDAIRMNADCMAVQTFIGADGQLSSLDNLNRVISAGMRYSIPTMGVCAVGKDMVYALSASYVMYFYQDVLGLSATFVGLILMAARVFDALNDPFMGGTGGKNEKPLGPVPPLAAQRDHT